MRAGPHDDCDKEPIHIPGCVQSYGALLVVEVATLRVVQCSVNVGNYLGRELSETQGFAIDAIFQPSLTQWLTCLEEGAFAHTRARARLAGDLNVFAHRQGRVYLLEVEFDGLADAESFTRFQADYDDALGALSQAPDLTSICHVVAREIRRLAGFDRVMVYRFDAHWNGAVIAESARPGSAPYLGQRFPASDIPQQARRVFLENWLRMIPDVDDARVALEPMLNPVAGAPLDLSRALLRSPSPVHLEYLRNMGVRATMTVSLIRDGVLWGLIAAHHETPKFVPHRLRQGCRSLGQLVSSLLVVKEQAEDAEYKARLQKCNERLAALMAAAPDIAAGLVKGHPNLLDLTAASGAAASIQFEGKWSLVGEVPSIDQLADLVFWLRTQHGAFNVYATHELPRVYPPAQRFKRVASGLLAVRIPKSADNFVLWFRPEVVHTVEWAGNPQELTQVAENGVWRIHPRKSFALWKETVQGQAIAWRPCEVDAAAQLRRAIVEIDLERQFMRERSARTDTEAEKQRFSFLAEVSATISASLDLQAVLNDFGTLATRAFCDWCVVHLFEGSGVQRSLLMHATRQGQEVADQLRGYPLPNVDARAPLGPGVPVDQSLLITRVTPTWLESVVPDPEHVRFLIDSLGIESVAAAALRVRGEVLGVLWLVSASRTRRYDAQDAQLVLEIARRIAVAVDNARLYAGSQKAIGARDHVLGVVSHDLKNPVGAIQLSADMMQRQLQRETHPLGEKLLRSLAKIDKSCRRINGLIADLLTVAKVEGGRFVVDKSEVSSSVLLEDACEMLEPLAQARQVHFKVQQPHTPTLLWCEPERIIQVLSNLVGNAIKFTPTGGSVTLTLQQGALEDVFTVTDTGPGIAAEDLPHIFDRFWQAQKTAVQGTGLGLSIVKGIVEAHGGRLWADSRLGFGTTIGFALPHKDDTG